MSRMHVPPDYRARKRMITSAVAAALAEAAARPSRDLPQAKAAFETFAERTLSDPDGQGAGLRSALAAACGAACRCLTVVQIGASEHAHERSPEVNAVARVPPLSDAAECLRLALLEIDDRTVPNNARALMYLLEYQCDASQCAEVFELTCAFLHALTGRITDDCARRWETIGAVLWVLAV